MLRALPSLDLGDVLIQARQPHSWIGSRAGDWERLRDEFRSWTADPDSRLAEVGRRGVALYKDLLRARRHRDQKDIRLYVWPSAP